MLRILFLTPDPVSTSPEMLTAEAERIMLALPRAAQPPLVSAAVAWRQSLDETAAIVHKYSPHILHFCKSVAPLAPATIDRSCDARLVQRREVLQSVMTDAPCVVIDSSVAAMLPELDQFADCAVRLRRPIASHAVAECMARFYGALAQGESMQQAFSLIQGGALPGSAGGLASLVCRTDVDPSMRYVLRTVRAHCIAARADHGYLRELTAWMMPLQRRGLLRFIGEEQALGTGRPMVEPAVPELILLLMGPELLNSRLHRPQLDRVLELHRIGAATLLPILTAEVDLSGTPFGEMLFLPPGGLPLSRLRDRAGGWSAILGVVERVAQAILRGRAVPPRLAAGMLTAAEENLSLAAAAKTVCGEAVRTGTAPLVRRLIDALLPLDSELTRFTLDYFPKTAQQFGDGMPRTAKINLLLAREGVDEVLAQLRRESDFYKHSHLLEAE